MRKHVIGSSILAVAIAGVAITQPASAAVVEKYWVGEGTEATHPDTAFWNNSTGNWVNSSGSSIGQPGTDQLAVFDRPFTNQPAITTHVTTAGGIWMTGNTVGDVVITSDPTGGNGGAPTFQTNGVTIGDTEGVGILLDNTSTGTLTINTSAFKADRTQMWTNNSANLFTILSPTQIANRTNPTIPTTVTINGTGDTLISGVLTGNGALVKDGTGTLTLAGDTTAHSGAITVVNGALLVTGSIAHQSITITVSGGTLGGTGTIARNTTVEAGGTLAPGAPGSTGRTLALNHNVKLEGTVAIDLFSDSDYEQVLVNGLNESNRTLMFGGTLEVVAAPGMTFAPGQVFDLFDWGEQTTVTGTFASISLPALEGGLSWKLFDDQPFDYATGQIEVVPEPLSAGALGLAGMGFVLARRRRQPIA